MQATATNGDDAELRVLVKQALATASRYHANRPYLDRDAVESEALAAAADAKRRWEIERATLSNFGALVIGSRLRRAYRDGRLFGDADARRLDAVSLDALKPDSDAEPQSRDSTAEAFDVDEFVGGLPISEADRELLRERLGGDRRAVDRDDRTRGEVRAAVLRIREAATRELNGGSPCSA